MEEAVSVEDHAGIIAIGGPALQLAQAATRPDSGRGRIHLHGSDPGHIAAGRVHLQSRSAADQQHPAELRDTIRDQGVQQVTIKAPAAIWSAAFFVVVFVAELIFGAGTVREAFQAIGTAAAGLMAVAGWIIKAREQYERSRQPEAEIYHTMDRAALQPDGFWRGFWLG